MSAGRALAAALVSAALVLPAAQAWAHARSSSTSSWQLESGPASSSARVTARASWRDLQGVLPQLAGATPAILDARADIVAAVDAYFTERFRLYAAGAPCEVAALGGGGLASGIAGHLRANGSRARFVACSPERSPVMARSIEAGKIVELPTRPTLSDATAGGLEPGAITLELCRKLVDDYPIVPEDEIRSALERFAEWTTMPIEGAGRL